MKKLSIFILLFISVLSFATDPSISTAGCIKYDATGCSAYLTGTFYEVKGWSAKGDIVITSGNLKSAGITFKSTGFGKGTLRAIYTTEEDQECYQSVEVDVFKCIPNDTLSNIDIEGPSCVSPGDVVVYSIKPIVTKNLDDRIGIDSYYWNIGSMLGRANSFVDSIYYSAGDGSSVTFKVKDWDETIGPNDISVIIGQCNIDGPKNSFTLSITKQAPKPDFGMEYLCVPYGDNTFTLSLINTASNVSYTWEKPIDWEFVDFNQDSTQVTIRPNKTTPGTITVSAAYNVNNGADCAITQTVLPIYRRWGSNVSIAGTECTVAEHSAYRYQVIGDLPTGTPVRWEIPTTWSVDGNELNSPLLKAYPTSLAQLTDTITAYELSECDSQDLQSTSIVVNVAPASVYVTGEQCVGIGQTYVYRAQRTATAVGPNAQQFAWYINGVQRNDLWADTAAILITSAINNIRVQPLGNNGCNGSLSDALEIMVNPATPTGIIRVDSLHCMATGTADTIILRIDGSVDSQEYVWDLSKTNNWSIIDYQTANHAEARIRTSGSAGLDTVQAYTQGHGLCLDTQPVIFTHTTIVPPFSIDIEARGRYYDIYSNPEDLATLALFENESSLYYIWYIDGEVEDEGYDATDITIKQSLLSSSSIVTLLIITDSGCKYMASTSLSAALNSVQSLLAPRKVSNEAVGAKEILLSPNPTNDKLTVTLPDAQSERTIVRIYSMEGKMLSRTVSTTEYTIDLSVAELPDGMYSMTINQDGEQYQKQFIVKH